MFNNDDAFLIIFKILYYCYECIKSGKSVELKYLRYEKLCINKEYFAYIMRQLELKNYILYADVVINCWTERINEFYITLDGIEYLESDKMATMKTYLQDKHQLEWWLESTYNN